MRMKLVVQQRRQLTLAAHYMATITNCLICQSLMLEDQHTGMIHHMPLLENEWSNKIRIDFKIDYHFMFD